ncbi:hypothetical protein GYMLUDRAFT_1008897 [Collybiopsis luxurians FD-317 M1]|nr:hypothetical protein GYMLUDRAFT_1008897 [Collybiopsis luxurians FD-317 M1]
MYLHWIDVDVVNTTELLWYLQQCPPPQIVLGATGTYAYVNTKLTIADSDEQTVTIRPPPPLPQVNIAPRPRGPSLFALIIGINKYKDPRVPDLHGAASDADTIQDFLISEVNVPAERIINLRNEDATREAIIIALESIADNESIDKQDPILIFYAGHGGEAKAPQGWATSTGDSTIQMLIPHDFVQEGARDFNGQGVFDMTLSRILENIALKKSDNITVIFDCCHSGSGTRDSRDETLAIRGVALPKTYNIPPEVLKLESAPRASKVAKGYEKSGLRSHVLLAACMRGQTAKERHGRGAFTSQLLELFKKEGVDKLTYKEIISRLPDLPLQNPQCEGDNQTRVLFNSKIAGPRRLLFKIKATASAKNQYILEAGEAHGLTNKAQFTIYPDEKMSTPIGTVTAWETTAFHTRCTSGVDNFELPATACAVQTRTGENQDLRLFVEANDAFLGLFVQLGQEMQRADTFKRSFCLVNSPNDKPNLAISAQNGFVQFHVMEQTCRAYGLTMMPHEDIRVEETDYLISVLRSAADFYWNLQHSNSKSVLSSKVSVECLKLVESGQHDDDFEPILVPQKADGEEVNLNIEGIVVIDVDEDVKYGFKINNTSNLPLYAALFYFDVSDVSVVPLYLPGTAKTGIADFSIPAHGSLTIGYGDSGTAPHEYFLRDNQNVDVGFLKLYLSTQYVDYSGIAQVSPFEQHRAGKPVTKQRLLWDTITIPMVQQKDVGSDRRSKLSANGGIGSKFNADFDAGGRYEGGFGTSFGASFDAGFDRRARS